MTTIKISLPSSLIFFVKFIKLMELEEYIKTYLMLCESLQTRTFFLKNSKSITNILGDIEKIFPYSCIIEDDHFSINQYVGVISIISLPNHIFGYVIKFNEKANKVIVEILAIITDPETRNSSKIFAYNLAQKFGYLLVNCY